MAHDWDMTVGCCRRCGLPVTDWSKPEPCKHPDGVVSMSYLHFRRNINKLWDDTVGPFSEWGA